MVQKVNRRPHTVEAYACACDCVCSCACNGGKNQYATQYKNYGATSYYMEKNVMDKGYHK